MLPVTLSISQHMQGGTPAVLGLCPHALADGQHDVTTCHGLMSWCKQALIRAQAAFRAPMQPTAMVKHAGSCGAAVHRKHAVDCIGNGAGRAAPSTAVQGVTTE